MRISAEFGQSRNVMFVTIYDIIVKTIAAQRFVASGFLVSGR
jgi:hypothetical protein